jgi:hypothetical protein
VNKIFYYERLSIFVYAVANFEIYVIEYKFCNLIFKISNWLFFIVFTAHKAIIPTENFNARKLVILLIECIEVTMVYTIKGITCLKTKRNFLYNGNAIFSDS